MFGKKRPSGNTTIIGKGARFTGSLELEGPIVIEGHCQGTIRTNGELSVGAEGNVEGELTGSTVSVAGKIHGVVVANETLTVLSSGQLEGEVYYGKLKVDSGGIIDGHSHQGTRPQAQANSLPPTAGDESGVLRAADRGVSAFPTAVGGRQSAPPGTR